MRKVRNNKLCGDGKYFYARLFESVMTNTNFCSCLHLPILSGENSENLDVYENIEIFSETLTCFSHILKIFQCFVKL